VSSSARAAIAGLGVQADVRYESGVRVRRVEKLPLSRICHRIAGTERIADHLGQKVERQFWPYSVEKLVGRVLSRNATAQDAPGATLAHPAMV
jgi:hypothetical protein